MAVWRRAAQELRRWGFTRGRTSAAAVCFAVAVALLRRLAKQAPVPPLVISLSAAFRLLKEGSVRRLVYTDGGLLLLRLKQPDRQFAALLVPGSEEALFRLADGAGAIVRYVPAPKKLERVLQVLLPMMVLAAWYVMAKALLSKEERNGMPKNPQRPRETVSFGDVVCKSKLELAEIVDYLNRPEKYKAAGARLPRGALLVGPSGTGKTLLARAVAGEARCSFLSASASEFVEVFVGRGAARVRDLFRQAREMTPVVLFLDELDALGSRSSGRDVRGSNEEYVQTLNQLLTELDGFHGQADGIVVLAATNRYEAIDPALLRPGRFDRHVFIELPDEEERLGILATHAKKAAMASEMPQSVLRSVAAGASGFSGAELANLVNEAVFLALRAQRSRCGPEDFAGALDRARLARQRGQQATGAQKVSSSLLRVLTS